MQNALFSKFRFEPVLAAVLAVGLLALLAGVLVERRAPVQTVAPEGTLEPIVVFPDFASFPDVNVKKQMFFDFLELYIAAENDKVKQVRSELLELADVASKNFHLSRTERRRLLAMARDYGVDTENRSEKQIIFELLKRVDTIPVSLALAQAANESAWGTSRFALEGNNVFGQWCYDQGCGLVPNRRSNAANHEVRSFTNVESAVQAYFINLNTHEEYEHFRELRSQMRDQQRELDSLVLAYGLVGYSERGEHYVDELQTIIQQNGLRTRDRI